MTKSAPQEAKTTNEIAIDALIARYPWQFKALFRFGLAVGPGWLPEIEAVCEFLDREIQDPRDRALFSWLQIKEKFGELRMYPRYSVELPFQFAPAGDPERTALLQVLPLLMTPGYWCMDEDDATPLLEIPERTQQVVDARIDVATKRCKHVCEQCGAPGELRKRDGWLSVQCDACAAVAEMQAFMQAAPVSDVDIKAMIRDGQAGEGVS